jgi:hypothetical protein
VSDLKPGEYIDSDGDLCRVRRNNAGELVDEWYEDGRWNLVQTVENVIKDRNCMDAARDAFLAEEKRLVEEAKTRVVFEAPGLRFVVIDGLVYVQHACCGVDEPTAWVADTTNQRPRLQACFDAGREEGRQEAVELAEAVKEFWEWLLQGEACRALTRRILGDKRQTTL